MQTHDGKEELLSVLLPCVGVEDGNYQRPQRQLGLQDIVEKGGLLRVGCLG